MLLHTDTAYICLAPQLPSIITSEPLEGGVEEVLFNKQPLGLWNFVAGKDNNEGVIERDFRQVRVSFRVMVKCKVRQVRHHKEKLLQL